MGRSCKRGCGDFLAGRIESFPLTRGGAICSRQAIRLNRSASSNDESNGRCKTIRITTKEKDARRATWWTSFTQFVLKVVSRVKSA